MIPSFLLLILVPWCVLMPRISGIPGHLYTVRPWVGTGPGPIQVLANASNPVAPLPNKLPAAIHLPLGATIRVVQNTCSPESLKRSSSGNASSTTMGTRDTTPTPTLASRTTRKSLSFRGIDKPSIHTTPTRARGNTVPVARTPERERDGDADSVISFTPSMSSKHLANWFSGLLGR
jgi:hypothetical protein